MKELASKHVNRFYFAGFPYNQQDLYKQGLWITHPQSPDGSGPRDFTEWHPLIFENNSVKWHDSDLESPKCHVTGLFAPTLREKTEESGCFITDIIALKESMIPATTNQKTVA